MKKILYTILILCLFTLCACQPQQTDIVTEIHRPDGSVVRYVNKSNGFGYNPNTTGNLNVGGVEGANNATIISGGGYGYGYGYGGYYGGGWGIGGYGYGGYYPDCNSFYYTPGCVTTPGAAPIPQNLNVYRYNPVINNGGMYYPANPCYPPSN